MEVVMIRRHSYSCLLFVLLVAAYLAGFNSGAWAGPNDKAALQGLQEGKIVFDITEGNGKKLLAKLNVIDETRQSLMHQGVTPHFVLTFRSGATRLVQMDMAKIKPENRDYAAQIAAKLKTISKAPGIESLEQCSVAVRLSNVVPEQVLPEVKVVGNGWISLMAYQARGYAYVLP
jgi:intracellular sulfur oxidation DsrE/DsrF family protein